MSEDLFTYFRVCCLHGLKKRGVEGQEEYCRQLDFEMEQIRRLGFVSYFLIVADMVAWARRHGIAVGPGRGSAAGSLVAYVLEITDIDPLRYRLYFERFLNPERVSPPDIDVDFASSRREEVLQYLRERYGAGRVAQIATFGKLHAKQAIRDVGRVLDIPYGEVDKIAKLVPPPLQGRQSSLYLAYEVVPELQRLRNSQTDAGRILRYAEKLEGLEKALSVHAAGVVISDVPLLDCLPLANAKGTVVTQFDMKDLDALGFTKFDILGLKNLDIVVDCVALVSQRRGEEIDWRRLIHQEDPAVFEYLKEGRYGGIFQLEATSGMRELILEAQPGSIEDLSAVIALFRPGPLGAGMKDTYLRVKQGKEKPVYLVPELEQILSVTHGQLIYQEQVLEICKQLAGYSLAEADLMRRAIGKKIPEEMEEQRQRFIQGMVNSGYDQGIAEQLFSQIETYAGYGFNKAHSVAYACITYITAYLKTYYRPEFYTALLNNSKEASQRDKFFSYLIELREEGITLLPPDINLSEVNFSLSDEGIRYGLSGIHSVGESVAQHLVAARTQRGGRFHNLRELVEAVDPRQVTVKILEALAKTGCFDGFGTDRRTLVENCKPFLDAVRKLNRRVPMIKSRRERELERVERLALAKPKEHGGEKLQRKIQKINERYHSDYEALNTEYETILGGLKEYEPYTRQELLQLEKEYLGFYLSGHPVDVYQPWLQRHGVPLVTQLLERQEVGFARVAGVVTGLKSRLTKHKKLMYSFLLEDAFRVLECIIFPDTVKRLKVIPENTCVILTGHLRKVIMDEAERYDFIVDDLSCLPPPEELPEAGPPPFRLLLDITQLSLEQLSQLHQLLKNFPGKHPLEYCCMMRQGTFIFQTDLLVDQQACRQALDSLPGVGVVRHVG